MNMEIKSNKKQWQNLIHRKCPSCNSRMEWSSSCFRCPDKDCGFAITGQKLIEILTDEGHIIHHFMSPHERDILESAIKIVLTQI